MFDRVAYSIEYRRKNRDVINARKRERKLDPRENIQRKPCMIITADEFELTIGAFDSMSQAARHFKKSLTNISKAYNNGSKIRIQTARERIWCKVIPMDEEEDDG